MFSSHHGTDHWNFAPQIEKKLGLNPLTLMSDQDNFSLQYQYNIQQTCDDNEEKCPLEDY